MAETERSTDDSDERERVASEIVRVRIDSHTTSGVERLEDVIRQMNAMVKLLSEFVTNPSISEVEVLGLSKHSPLTATLQVVTIRKRRPVKKSDPFPKPIVRAIGAPIRALERTYDLATGTKKSKSENAPSLLALSDFGKQLRNDVATIETRDRLMVLDRGIVAQIDDKLGSVRKSHGTVSGVIEGLNVHSKPWTFTIYPEIGPRKIRCFFREELLPDVQAAIRQRVLIRGTKEYVLDSPFPTRMQVESIAPNVEAPSGSWLSLTQDLIEAWESSDDSERASVLEGWAA